MTIVIFVPIYIVNSKIFTHSLPFFHSLSLNIYPPPPYLSFSRSLYFRLTFIIFSSLFLSYPFYILYLSILLLKCRYRSLSHFKLLPQRQVSYRQVSRNIEKFFILLFNSEQKKKIFRKSQLLFILSSKENIKVSWVLLFKQ